MEQKKVGIDLQLSNPKKEVIEKSRARLRPIIDAIITCGRQNIALRGHRDDAQYYTDKDITNPGNFIEILKYGDRCGNLIYFSRIVAPMKHIDLKQSKMKSLKFVVRQITDNLLTEIKRAKYVSVLADEATNCSYVEQLAIVLRFVDGTLKIREEFLGFVSCRDGLSGKVQG